MTKQALFVDLPNFYSHLLTSGIEEPRLLRDYFLDWFDFDRFSTKLTGEASSVWVFYSGRRFGPKPNRIEDKYLDGFIERINSLRGVTARDVNIPGQQREPAAYKCEKCQHEGVAQWESEKGIDASLTVHLFDTMDSWDVAYLLSADADFVPAVASLRRRGKIVVGAGFPDASSALIRECYDYLDLSGAFLKKDVALYTLFGKNRIVHKWLTDELSFSTTIDPPERVEVKVEVNIRRSPEGHKPFGHSLHLSIDNGIDISDLKQLIERFQTKFTDQIQVNETPLKGNYQFAISLTDWEEIKKHKFQELASSIQNIEVVKLGGRETYTIRHQYNQDTKKYDRA